MSNTRIFDIIPETALVDIVERADLSKILKTVGEAFDTAFYLSHYPDIVSHKDVDPLEHYCGSRPFTGILDRVLPRQQS
jgi:hypothetical protein